MNSDEPRSNILGTSYFGIPTSMIFKELEVTIDNGDDAKDALDRISIPKEVLDRIAPTALPRSSIIVSDEPLSRETTIAPSLLRCSSNQPQGGFITRRPTMSFPPASRKS